MGGEDGGHAPAAAHDTTPAPGQHAEHKPPSIVTNGIAAEPDLSSPMSPRIKTPNPFSRKNTSLDINDYFVRAGSAPRAEREGRSG